MKPLSQLILSSILIIVLVSCSEDFNDNNCISGQGSVINDTRDTQPFSIIDKSSTLDLMILRSDTERISVTAQENIQDLVTTTFIGNTLEIKLQEGCYNNIDIEVIIETARLEELVMSGTGDVVMQGFTDLDEFSVDKSSTGDLELDGSCSVLNLNIGGTGDVKAFDFVTGICNLDKSGTGTAEITVQTTLQGSVSGTGDVFYKGNPTIDLDISGTAELIDAN